MALYIFFFTLLDGSSLFATLLFALLMRDRVRSIGTSQGASLPQLRSLWRLNNRLVLGAALVLLVGGDFFVGGSFPAKSPQMTHTGITFGFPYFWSRIRLAPLIPLGSRTGSRTYFF